MSYGMSRDEYWNGDIMAAFDYVEAEQYRYKRLNEQLWLQGMYVCDAVAVAVNNTVGMALTQGKCGQANYPDKPYGTQKTEKEKELEEENETLQAKLWLQTLVDKGKDWGKEEK